MTGTLAADAAVGHRIEAIDLEDDGDQSCFVTVRLENGTSLIVSVRRCCCGGSDVYVETPEEA